MTGRIEDFYEEFIYLRTYSRWNYELERREKWEETVTRYFDFLEPRVPEKLKKSYHRAKEFILEKKVMPSMRALWSAGPALKQNHIAAYNCLSGNTKILTKVLGLIEIKNALGNHQILDGNNNWTFSEIKKFGSGELVDITFSSKSRLLTVSATPDHRWLLSDGKEVLTKDLKKGQKISYHKAPRIVNEKSIDYELGIIHGLIYGDGTMNCKRNNGYVIRLCSDQEDLLKYFKNYPRSYPKSYNGDPVVYIYDDFAKTHLLKELPSDKETSDYMIGFFRGWLAADGYISKSGQVDISLGKEESDWVYRIMPKYGYWFLNLKKESDFTNYGKRKKKIFRLSLDRASIDESDLIIERKRKRYKKLEVLYSVNKVEYNGKKEDFYCATVPTTSSFVLDKGILTGNCAFANINSTRIFSEAMMIVMNGAGFGFSVERQYISELPLLPDDLIENKKVIKFADSKEGWCSGYQQFLDGLYSGKVFQYDMSEIRPKGAVLKTFGGRASGPEPLVEVLKFTENIFRKAIQNNERRLNSLECHDIMCAIASAIVVGGVRRAALISLSNHSDLRMRDAKKGNFWETELQRTLANNSVAYTEKPSMSLFLEEWTSLMNSGTGERGIVNKISLDNIIKRNKRRKSKWTYISDKGEIKEYTAERDIGTNPCIQGDVLVAVADGRGYVSIKELTNEGEDVPVYTLDNKNKIVVRMMRNPHLTKSNAKIYRVTLDNGQYVDVTDNHKFKLKNGDYEEVKNIENGTSLEIMNSYYANALGFDENKLKNKNNYKFLQCGTNKKSEHRLIAEFGYGDIPKNHVVHHLNFNSKDNRLENLKIMEVKEHRKYHSDRMKGENNPMVKLMKYGTEEEKQNHRNKMSILSKGESNSNYSGISSTDLKKYAISLTETLGRRFSSNEWSEYSKENNLPQHFTKWRKDHLDTSGYSLSKWAALTLGYENLDSDPRVVKRYIKFLEQDYDCYIEKNKIFFKKKCEVCGINFSTMRREHGICSRSCSAKQSYEIHKDRISYNQKQFFENRKLKIQQKQLEIFNDLKYNLGREPFKKEWKSACNEKNVSNEISRISSPFRCWNDLKESAISYNHKIVSIEYIGTDDVYNGSVDEYHNFFIGGFEEENEQIVCINNKNCSEIILRPEQFCNLSSVIVRHDDTLNDLTEKIKYATILGILQSTLTDFKYVNENWKNNCDEERLLGVSLNGVMDHPILSNEIKSERLGDWLTNMKDTAIKVAKKWSKELNINMPTAITAIKPEGNSSQLVGTASGLHPRYSKFYIRRVRVSKSDVICKYLQDKGFKWEPDVGTTKENYSIAVFEFPIKSPKKAICRNDKTALQQLEHWKLMQLYYCEHKPSITVYVRENEWLEVGAWVYKNWDICSGISFLPYDNGRYQLAPFEELTEDEYKEMCKNFPKDLNFDGLSEYEKEDYTTGAKELSCHGGSCEI